LHKIGNMFMWHHKEHQLKIPIYVVNLSKKPISEDMTIPQDFQRGGCENGHFEITMFGYFVVPTRREFFLFKYVP
jgi:hypothetical protein